MSGERAEALEAALAEVQALALANGMRADAAERRIAKALAAHAKPGADESTVLDAMAEALRGE